MEIKISKQEIFNEVEKRSSLEGFMFPDRYDNVWVSPDRGELIESYWIEGCIAITQLFKKYISNDSVAHSLSSYDKDEVFAINAQMPERYNSMLDGSIVTSAKMVVACNIIQKWLSVTSPELSAKYGEESSAYVEDIKQKLYYRKSPDSRTQFKALSDEESMVKSEYIPWVKTDEEKLEQCWNCKC